MRIPTLLVIPLLFYSLSRPAEADDWSRSYSCKPALPVFCRNIHVSCAGATRIRTTPFNVWISDADALVTFAGSDTPLRGRVGDGRDLVIRLHDSRDWIRIERNDRFSHRIYRKRGAAMSYGMCKRQVG